MVQSAQRRWEEEQQRFAVERDTIHKVHLSELEFLLKEKAGEEMACQKTNVALQRTERMLKNVEAEQHGCSKMLKVQASRLDFKAKQQERLIQDLKAAAVKIKELEDNAAAARLAHIDCKYTTEIMQVDRSILLNLYQSMANAHVLAKQTNAPLEELPWTEFCALLHENVEALILNFHKANKRRYLI
ncbi:coiled-coil domain-containing protein 171-like isoform X2 [Passer domesticus]|uniref:coiled-coil domain-containing protein 171-like isoform X2 n=1 Tax=Passer domesticus TaxID=48849 RepID=UPI0030FE4FC1